MKHNCHEIKEILTMFLTYCVFDSENFEYNFQVKFNHLLLFS
jgi:hypothetical protein